MHTRRHAPLCFGPLIPGGCPEKKHRSYFIRKVYGTEPLSFLPVLAGKDGLELRDTQQVRVRGDYEVGMFGQSGGQVEAIIVRKGVFL